jgi:hypothetical protein
MNSRLIDLFVSGPLQIYISFYLKQYVFKYFMLITGISNILYNTHNYLLLDKKILQKPLPILKPFIDLNHGKRQFHRLYNLIIMYPLFFYIIMNYHLPIYLRIMFIINIIVGFTFNLYYFLVIKYKN